MRIKWHTFVFTLLNINNTRYKIIDIGGVVIDFWQGDLDKAKVSFEECKRILELGQYDDIVIMNW